MLRRRARQDTGAAGATPAAEAMALEQFRTALNAVPFGVVLVGPDGSESWRNRGVYELLGGSGAATDAERTVAELASSAVRGRKSRREVESAGPPERALLMRSLPMVNGGGMVLIEDVTERRLVDKVRTDFVSNISHELKTPIGALSLLAETIGAELSAGDDTLRRLSGRMVDETARVARIIDDLLELASIEFVGTSRREQVVVDDIVREVVSRYEHVARAKSVALNLLLGDEPVTALVDPRQIQTAVGNLVENAVKYTDTHGSVGVEVRTDEGSLVVIVHDTGSGIPAEHMDRIFERFYRVDDARSRETGGTGLGLAIVRHVATNHGGEVNVRSHPGEGSTFTLRIPLALG